MSTIACARESSRSSITQPLPPHLDRGVTDCRTAHHHTRRPRHIQHAHQPPFQSPTVPPPPTPPPMPPPHVQPPPSDPATARTTHPSKPAPSPPPTPPEPAHPPPHPRTGRTPATEPPNSHAHR